MILLELIIGLLVAGIIAWIAAQWNSSVPKWIARSTFFTGTSTQTTGLAMAQCSSGGLNEVRANPIERIGDQAVDAPGEQLARRAPVIHRPGQDCVAGGVDLHSEVPAERPVVAVHGHAVEIAHQLAPVRRDAAKKQPARQVGRGGTRRGERNRGERRQDRRLARWTFDLPRHRSKCAPTSMPT